MAACKQLTRNGERFLAMTLYLQQEAKKRGQRLHVWKVLKAWEEGSLDGIAVKIADIQECE